MKRALITGVGGQDGAYLSELLLGKGYAVSGMVRRRSVGGLEDERLRWLGVADRVRFVDGDLSDLSTLLRAVEETAPDEVYNLAAQSLVKTSWNQPIATAGATGLGALNMLEAVRTVAPTARFYQASSSEIFGRAQSPIQNERTALYPRSPYGVSKAFAHWMTVNYRESFGMHASSGILFNHESPLRSIEFVTRKITDGVVRIKLGLADTLTLGNTQVRRDWGHARDHVRAMWQMLQQPAPDDYVIATGHTASVREFCDLTFAEVGVRAGDHVRIDETLFRPAEIEALQGDASKARAVLGWAPTITLPELVAEMVAADLARLSGTTGRSF